MRQGKKEDQFPEDVFGVKSIIRDEGTPRFIAQLAPVNHSSALTYALPSIIKICEMYNIQ